MTRREVMQRMAIAGSGSAALSSAALSATETKVNFSVPKLACDCHTHIFGDPARFPFFEGRGYTPQPAFPAAMRALHRTLHMDRVVIVTPSVYGTDNGATLYGIKALGRRARGVAVVADAVSDRELATLHAGGVRGIRLNLVSNGQNDATQNHARLRAVIGRMHARGWHVQIYTNLAAITAMRPIVAESKVPIIFDHFGGANAALGTAQPGFADLVALVASGQAYVKISGAYRASSKAPEYAEVTPFAQALLAANPDRVLWGTDWPHPDSNAVPGRKPTDIRPGLPIDDVALLNQLPLWAPDEGVRAKVLVHNPALLYEF